VSPRVLGCAIVLALAACGFGCSSPDEVLARHLERAQAYQEAGQFDKALVELKSALKLDPQSADTNLRIATLHEQDEEYGEALFYFGEALRLDPGNEEAALGTGRLLRFQETDRAEKLVAEVLERNPRSSRAYVLRSDILLVRGDVDGALAAALTAVELEPDSARVALQVAMVRKAVIAEQRRSGQPDDPEAFAAADAALAQAIELAKNDPYWMVRGVIERARLLVTWKGYAPEQKAIYESAYAELKEYPDLARRIAEAATVHARGAQDNEFLHWALSRMVETAPYHYASWVELAQLATQQGEDGVAVLARMSQQLENDTQAQITYADHLSGLGRHAEAVEHLESFLPKSQAPAATLAALVQLHIGARDAPAAKLALDRLRADYSDTGPADQAEASLARAEGRLADEIAALERWTTREETVIGFGLLADARLRAGRPRGALDAVDRALSLRQEPRPDLQQLRGRALVRLGEHRAGLHAFSRARSMGGPLPDAYLPDLATAYYALGRREEARKVLERALAADAPTPQALMLFAREEGPNDRQAARVALERGERLYGGALPFVAGLANLDLRDGKPEAALERVRAAAAQAPDSPDAQKLLVEMLVTRGLNDEAAQHVELVQERWPSYLGVAELYFNVMKLAGRGDEAFEALSKKQAARQLSPFGRVVLARLHRARGEDDKEIELLRSALAEVPELPSAANDLAYALARRGEDLQEATELAQEARASRPESSEIADTLGFVYMRRNLAEAALVQFDAALDLAEPEGSAWATAQFHRGLALRELGREEEAVVALEKALASGADFAEVDEAHQALAELAKAATPAGARKEGS
jgi:tetratricopeptide (TPR) repeat protein